MSEPSLFQNEVDRLFRRLGLTGQAAAALMVLFGILILMFPGLVAVLIGVYLVVVGLLQLLGSFDAARAGTGGSGRSASRSPPGAPRAGP